MDNMTAAGRYNRHPRGSIAAASYTQIDRAYLVIDAIDSTRTCTHVGDVDAYCWLRGLLDELCAAVLTRKGEVVKCLGDGMEACFAEPAAALSCAWSLLARSASAGLPALPKVRIGLGYGCLIRYHIDGHADYFGREVIIAARLARYGSEPALYMTSAFRTSLLATEADDAGAEPISVRCKGWDQPIAVYRLTADPRRRRYATVAAPTLQPECGRAAKPAAQPQQATAGLSLDPSLARLANC